MISKMDPVEGKGARLAIVFNGSPLFTGGGRVRRVEDPPMDPGERLAGGHRRPARPALLQHRHLDVLLDPVQPKGTDARDKVILLDARDQWKKMRKSLGDKRKQISDAQIEHITKLYMDAVEVAADTEHPDHGKVRSSGPATSATTASPSSARSSSASRSPKTPSWRWRKPSRWPSGTAGTRDRGATGFGRLGLVDKEGGHCGPARGGTAADAYRPSTAAMLKGLWNAVSVADPEGEVQTAPGRNAPTGPRPARLRERPARRRHRRLLRPRGPPPRPGSLDRPHKTKIGYEIPFTRHFYVYTPPRPLAEIDAELRDLEAQIQKLLGEVTG